MKKLVFFGLLLLVLAFTFEAEIVNASPEDIWVPYDYPTIQAAINAANQGDTIHVASGTYDPVVVNKSLTLIGEGEAIIDGHGAGIVGIDVTADHVYIYNLKIQNGNSSIEGIRLKGAAFCYVKNNYIRDFGYGVILDYVSNSCVSNNTIRDCAWPSIYLHHSSNNHIVTNNIYNSTWGGISLDSSSSFNMVSDNNITIIDTGAIGIGISYYSLNNTVCNNWINCSDVPIDLHAHTSNNLIYHNNFVGATNQVKIDATSVDNKWYLNWPVGGNFWSNHVSSDICSGKYQNQLGSDGICDDSYTVTEGVMDLYPLRAQCTHFEVYLHPIPTPEEISIISNSSISSFQLNATERTIKFNVIGEDGIGFCRVDIPNTIVEGLWAGNYTVKIDNTQPLYMRNWTENTKTYIYFTYNHSIHQVIIIPEFPSSMALLGFLMLITISLIFTKKGQTRKANKEPNFPPFSCNS